jgi:hypothetical protein
VTASNGLRTGISTGHPTARKCDAREHRPRRAAVAGVWTGARRRLRGVPSPRRLSRRAWSATSTGANSRSASPAAAEPHASSSCASFHRGRAGRADPRPDIRRSGSNCGATFASIRSAR